MNLASSLPPILIGNLLLLVSVLLTLDQVQSSYPSYSWKRVNFWQKPQNYHKYPYNSYPYDLIDSRISSGVSDGLLKSMMSSANSVRNMWDTFMGQSQSSSSNAVYQYQNPNMKNKYMMEEIQDMMSELPISPCLLLPLAKFGIIPIIVIGAIALAAGLIVLAVPVALITLGAFAIKLFIIKKKKLLLLKAPVIVVTTTEAPCIFTAIANQDFSGPRQDIPIIRGQCFTLPMEFWTAERHAANTHGKCFMLFNGADCTGQTATTTTSQNDQVLMAGAIDAYRSIRTC